MSKRLIAPTSLPEYGIILSNDSRKDLESRGQFPKRVWVTERTHAYVEAEILEFSAKRIAARDGKAA
jgi:hypothetical protein